MNNSDTLTLFLDSSNDSVLGIKIENSDKNTTSTFHLKFDGFECRRYFYPTCGF